MAKRQFGPYTVTYEHGDKIYYPAQGKRSGITKEEVVAYYADISPVMLRHIAKRPLTVQRFPDGIAGGGFYMQEAQDYFPPWLGRVAAEKADGTSIEHPMAQRAADLAYLASKGALVFHIWLAQQGVLNQPDCLVFDLDPPGDKNKEPDKNFAMVRAAALDVRELLDELGLACFVKTTGSRGLHVVAPLKPQKDFDAVREFCREAALVLVRRKPDSYTLEQRKDKRKGRLYLDVMRNAYGQHMAAPYTLRAKPGAPVSAPVSWREVENGALGPQDVGVRSVRDRLERRGDPWRTIWRHRRSLNACFKRLDALLER